MKIKKLALVSVLVFISLFVSGSTVRRTPARNHGDIIPAGSPHYDELFANGMLRIAVFWGWDHPREAVMGSFPVFETLNGRTLFYQGRPVEVEIGMITQINDDPLDLFVQTLEDPEIDVVIYSGHARFGQGMAFETKHDIFRSGKGDLVEDRHVTPHKVVRATATDLQKVRFPEQYKIVFINACDSEDHFRESWTRRFIECNAPVDLVTVEYPVFNLHDDRRVMTFVRDLVSFADWKTIKKNYDAQVHRRKNKLVVKPVKIEYENKEFCSSLLGLD